MAAVLAMLAKFNILEGCSIKMTHSWLAHKRLKAKTYMMEALHRNDRLFHNMLKVLKIQIQSC